ncbi:hypothetical protein CHISP_2295 [Chitinispirillum alkaliphilum]|nr:hypothetical protein CHISP_2295 [Chitinispirillum alkaliphilum]
MNSVKQVKKALKKNSGFTLVEVIVVAVIVAVLALGAIQLYQGYIRDSRSNTAENLASSAAGYITTERNRGASGSVSVNDGVITFDTDATGESTRFSVPDNANLIITGNASDGGTVAVSIDGDTSNTYDY